MSDLTASNCGCGSTPFSTNCGGGCNNTWLILLLLLSNNGCGGGCGNGFGLFNNGGCGDSNCGCDWLIWILLISCFCGGNGERGGCGC